MKYILPVTALAAFCVMLGTSCSKTNNYYDDDDEDRVAIRLSSNVEMGTLRLQDTQIAAGQSLSLFVTESDEDGNNPTLYNNQEIIANGNGGFTYEQTMYYPTNGNDVNFYAVHPYVSTASLNQPLSFSIVTDQSDVTGYLDSDLLYATRTDVTRTTSAVSMIFSHKMAKLDFVIIQGDGADISGLSEVTTLNVLPSTTINLSANTLTPATGTATEIVSYGANDPNDEVNGRLSGITSIIVPQTLGPGRIFRIRLGEIDYYYTSDTGISFETGKKYTLQLRINQAEITLTSSIENWTDGGTITGDGSID